MEDIKVMQYCAQGQGTGFGDSGRRMHVFQCSVATSMMHARFLCQSQGSHGCSSWSFLGTRVKLVTETIMQVMKNTVIGPQDADVVRLLV
jgi:hypothetical protein